MTRRALMHGMRRRILRVLNQTKAPITLPDLAAVLPDASLSQISYHVLVLTDCGNVGISGEEPAGGSLNRSFISTGAGNPQLVAILQETETLDDVR